MGVPKFYRWISERYPNIGRVIDDNQLPDFDNFYLDMNGIIHACSHVNEDNCETNVTEKEIFRNIFHYLDFLFRMIKPKKVFFMAIDGVAPRAKMNQQRARRFRAGQDRERKLKSIATKLGKSFEETAAQHFDTNAITPGTQFMEKLDQQLRYFINVKLTTDPLWEGVDIHLSGHLTPGEGEHKIMDYIRYSRSQPGYNVNTRHCLYGLDADLIMLGLVTHELHFALLREEVKYGSKKISKILTPEEITWHLLHTCLLRDYIDLEFRSLKEKLHFPYNLESIIDDWILMAYLVGNDFIPHLPHIHIQGEALTLLWDTYKTILPTLDGYMNESGKLNLARFETYLTELAKFDHQRFANENDAFRHLAKLNGARRARSKKQSQSDNDGGFDLGVLDKLADPVTTTDKEKLPPIPMPPDDNGLVDADDDHSSSHSDSLSDKSLDEHDEYERKLVEQLKPINEDDFDRMPLIEAEFRQHKNHYYREKMKIDLTSSDQLKTYVKQYIEALKWILEYYYQGCPSWSWFYPQHYAPYLSDLKNFRDLELNFQEGTPFKPFEQLLGVLPPTSRRLLPAALQSLMIDASSPLLHFYPAYFELDQNEKKNSWESIVLLPFIDEVLLLNAITQQYPHLEKPEQNRNEHLGSSCFRATPTLRPTEGALAENPYFPPLKETRASCTVIPRDAYQSDHSSLKHGSLDDTKMVIFPKFPVLNVLPYQYGYKSSAVNLFDTHSCATTLVLNLTHQPDPDCITYNNEWKRKDSTDSSPFQITDLKGLITRYLGQRVFVNWPHFEYGTVCAISDFRHLYVWTNNPGGFFFDSPSFNSNEEQDLRNYKQTPTYVARRPFEITEEQSKPPTWNVYQLNDEQTQREYTKAIQINRQYELRQGVSIGPIPVLLYLCPLIGYRTICSSSSDKCQTNMCFSNQALAYSLQTTLLNIPNYKHDLYERPSSLSDYLRPGDSVFALQVPFYSSLARVQGIEKKPSGKYSVSCEIEPSHLTKHPDLTRVLQKFDQHRLTYWTAQQVADYLGTLPTVIGKITGKVNVFFGGKQRKRVIPTNIGLLWKANKPVIKQVYGYTRKVDQIWTYSDAAVKIISQYMKEFPEVFEELARHPNDDSYLDSNLWPDKDGKKRLNQLRQWVKSLPTYSIGLTDGQWQMLDAPVIAEVDRYIKSFYAKQIEKGSNAKTKIVSFEPENIFRSSEALGMCEPEMGTVFYLFDRVVNVRLGTGVPIGAHGTVVGIMHGPTHLDAYYEILFDHLPDTSLEAILLGKHDQTCRIKVRSYHLLNYSHSLRLRSMNENYHQQRSAPYMNARQQSMFDPTSSHMAHRAPNQNHPGVQPKSAPPGVHRGNPMSTQLQTRPFAVNHSPEPLLVGSGQVQRSPETTFNQPNGSYIVFQSTTQHPNMMNSPPIGQHPFQQQYSVHPPQLMDQHYSLIDQNYRPSPLPPTFSAMNMTSPGVLSNSPQNANVNPFMASLPADRSPPAPTQPITPSRVLNPFAAAFSPSQGPPSPPQN